MDGDREHEKRMDDNDQIRRKDATIQQLQNRSLHEPGTTERQIHT